MWTAMVLRSLVAQAADDFIHEYPTDRRAKVTKTENIKNASNNAIVGQR